MTTPTKNPDEPAGSKADKFEPPGINFKAKVIGIVDVPEARGDQMCLENMGKLKAIVKEKGEHKQKIVINVSLEGIKVIDEKTLGLNHTHEVHKISFISRDPTDRRAFGYVYGEEGHHKFYAIKTAQQADQLVLSLKQLFEAVLELKQQQVSVQKLKIEETTVYLQTSYDEPIGAATHKKQENGGVIQERISAEATDSPLYAIPDKPTSPASAEGMKQRALSNLVDLEKEMKTIQEGISTMSDFDLAFESLPPKTDKTQDNPFTTGDPFAPAPAAAAPQQAPAASGGSVDLFSVQSPTATSALPTRKSSDDLFAEFSDTFTSPAASLPMPTQPPPPNPFASGGFGGAGAGAGFGGGFGGAGFGQQAAPMAFQSSGFQQPAPAAFQQPAPAAFQSAWGPPQPQAQQQQQMGAFGAPVQQKSTSDPFGGGFGGGGGGFDSFTLQPQSTAPPPGQKAGDAPKPDPFGDIGLLGGSKPAASSGGKKQDPFKGFKMAKPGEVGVPDFNQKNQDPFGAPAAGGNKGITTSDGKPLFDDSPFGF